MKTSSLVILVLIASIDVAHASPKYDPDTSNWSVVTPPRRGDVDYYDFMSRADYDWVVRQENGKVLASLRGDSKLSTSEGPSFDTTVELQASKEPADMFMKVDDGWIATYNRGEFGAAVYWFSMDGKKRRKLSDHHINEFLIDKDRIFAAEGLSHFVPSGSMIELRKEDGKWGAYEFVTLPGSAEAITRVSYGDYVIVVDHMQSMLLRVNLKKEVNILVPDGDWAYANSIAISEDGFIYVGARKFVVRCKLAKSVQQCQLLIPNKNWLNTKEKGDATL